MRQPNSATCSIVIPGFRSLIEDFAEPDGAKIIYSDAVDNDRFRGPAVRSWTLTSGSRKLSLEELPIPTVSQWGEDAVVLVLKTGHPAF